MRLLVYTDATGWGGAEISLGNLLAELSPSIQVRVLGAEPGVVRRIAARRPGTRTTVLPPVRDKLDLAGMWRHRAVVASLRPDIFQANLQTPAAAQYALLAAVTVPRVKALAVEHLPMPMPSRLGRALKRATSRRLAAHVAVGTRAARAVEQIAGLPSNSLRVIYNGVPDHPAVPDHAGAPDRPRSARAPVPGFTVGSVGRLDAQKGYDVLIRAVSTLPSVQLVLVGDGPERGELERLATELGMRERLHLPGWTDSARAHLASFDVFALPSRYEGFPLSILEAMSSGLPVVATDVGDVREAVRPGRTGLLVQPDDAVGLADALRRVLGDGAERSAMGLAARKLAQRHFTSAVMVREFESLYEEILSR